MLRWAESPSQSTHMLFSKDLISSLHRIESSSTIDSASLLPGNRAASSNVLKTRYETKKWNCNQHKCIWFKQKFTASPSHGLYLHGGDTQHFGHFVFSLGTKLAMDECLETCREWRKTHRYELTQHREVIIPDIQKTRVYFRVVFDKRHGRGRSLTFASLWWQYPECLSRVTQIQPLLTIANGYRHVSVCWVRWCKRWWNL